jgi:predicted RNA-binding Zn ribbon-like protein
MTTSAVDFANTVVAERGKVRDDLDAWLAAEELSAATERFRELRDAVRGLLTAATSGGEFTDADLAVVNAASSAAPHWPVLVRKPDGELTVRDDCTDSNTPAQQLAALARQTVRLLGGAQRADLRACQGPGCVQFFVKDHPRREWCGPGCGNRARAARHYHKHRDRQSG